MLLFFSFFSFVSPWSLLMVCLFLIETPHPLSVHVTQSWPFRVPSHRVSSGLVSEVKTVHVDHKTFETKDS